MPYRILVVDDNPGTLLVLKRLLIRIDPGLDIRCAKSTEEAFPILDEAARAGRPFQLAIVDLNLPGIDGLGLKSLIEDRQPLLDFLFISASNYEEWCSRIFPMPDWPAFMKKPISEEEFRRFWEERFDTAGIFAG